MKFNNFREVSMNLIVKGVMLCTLLAASLLYGEVTFAASNVFSFPAMTSVRTTHQAQAPAFFTSSGLNPVTRNVAFSWNFPAKAKDLSGSITLFSLQGKVVARIPVNNHSGSTLWVPPASFCRNGIYIARIKYGVENRNLKLMLWR